MTYTIEHHQHRLSAWAASTAARASNKCRFKVETGMAILEASGFTADFTVKDLPNPKQMDGAHRIWRKRVIANAAKRGTRFSHGVAAKLINCYMKIRFVCGGHHTEKRVSVLHPPVDRLLLDSLAKADFGGQGMQWRQFCKHGWSNYDSQTYEEVIALMRRTLGDEEPLWKIEEHWKGHQ